MKDADKKIAEAMMMGVAYSCLNIPRPRDTTKWEQRQRYGLPCSDYSYWLQTLISRYSSKTTSLKSIFDELSRAGCVSPSGVTHRKKTKSILRNSIMNKDVEIRHVTPADGNVFADLGFDIQEVARQDEPQIF